MVANPVHLLGPLREAAQQTRAGQASEAYALFLFLRSKDFLAVGDSYAQPLADRVRVFARKRENVGQEGFDALVHRVPRHAARQLSG